MPRLTAPDAIRDARPADASRAALDSARDALDQARKAVDEARAAAGGGPRIAAPDIDLGKVGGSIRRTIDDVLARTSEVAGRGSDTLADALPDRTPDPSAVTDRLPKRADILAAVPGAVELARRVPSLEEMRSSAADVAASTREAALEAARQTPLRDHPAVRRGPGPLGIVVRIGVASLVASAVAFVILNRDRIRSALLGARTRAAGRQWGMRDELDSGAWAAAAGPSVTVDEVVAVETMDDPLVTSEMDAVATSPADALAMGDTSTTADQPVEDLDAAGWGTEGRPTAPRQLSADVASMTNPSPPLGRPDELGE